MADGSPIGPPYKQTFIVQSISPQEALGDDRLPVLGDKVTLMAREFEVKPSGRGTFEVIVSYRRCCPDDDGK